jgi:ABC-2 type transport system ATP-binding protein
MSVDRTSSGPAIRCVGVEKRFGRVAALDGLDLEVPRGQVVGFLGPNGAGKSTTIRILMDLARADRGVVEVLGADPRGAGPALRTRIGYLPGELRLDERLDVGETLELWSRLRGDVDPREIDRLCERLGLDPTRETRGLSSGNRRKVGLVGAFMARPELLVLDEPTSGIDPLVQAAFADLVAEAAAEGGTVFLSSHVLSEVQRLADHVIVIRAGRVVASGAVAELRHLARQPFRVTFAGPPPVDELRAARGVTDVEVRGPEVTGLVEGSPDELLSVLARHPVASLLMPEPDLEDAFLRMYDDAVPGTDVPGTDVPGDDVPGDDVAEGDARASGGEGS